MPAWTIYISFIGALLTICLPQKKESFAKVIALITSIVSLGISLIGAYEHPGGGQIVEITRLQWIRALGIQYYLAADGISIVLVVLTSIASLAGILFSWNITHRAREYFGFYLLLIGSVYGVFLSYDIFLLFVFYELAIIPKYFLIAIWGSTNKEYGAMKLVLYSFVGSALVLLGLISIYIVSGGKGMSIIELANFKFPLSFQEWIFPVVFIGFGILAGLYPFHTWAPTGHVAAPTAASMLLAGVIMKLGAYGCLRIALTLFPDGAYMWRIPFAVLGVAGIILGALTAFTQRDFKFVIGYSSVSHMGFVIVGLLTLNKIGLCGAIYQMFSHGIIAGLLFGVVGRMVYDRTHTRDLSLLEQMSLSRALPFAAFTFVVAGFASMGLPGFSGFIAELQVLIGAWKTFPIITFLAGAGIVLGASYILRAMQKAFFSGTDHYNKNHLLKLEGISFPEKIGAFILIITTLITGLFPELLLKWIIPALEQPLFNGLWKGGNL